MIGRLAIRLFAPAIAAGLVLVIDASPLRAQAPPPPPGGMPQPGNTSPQLPLPGQSSTSMLPARISLGAPSVLGFPAFRESAIELTATGPSGVAMTIRSLPNMTLPGSQSLASLVDLVDVPPPATAVVAAPSTTTSSGPATIVGRAQDPRLARLPTQLPGSGTTLSKPVTVRKMLVFRGLNRNSVAAPDTFFRTFTMEVQASAGGATSIVRAINVVLSNDDGPPAIVSLSSVASSASNSGSSTDFPPLVEPTGADADLYATKTYKLNWVKLHRKVTVIATDFSVDGARPSADFQRFYRLVTQYEDGAKFVYPYENLGVYQSEPRSLRLQLTVPNIRRGSFRIYLQSPYGISPVSQVNSFSSNQFVTSLPVAQGSVLGINVDSPLYVGGFESLLGVVEGSYQYPVLPANPKCGNYYANWDSVSMGAVELFPVGLASARFTSTPSANTVVHSGNMPKIIATAGGLGTVKAHWVGRMKVHVGECAENRLLE